MDTEHLDAQPAWFAAALVMWHATWVKHSCLGNRPVRWRRLVRLRLWRAVTAIRSLVWPWGSGTSVSRLGVRSVSPLEQCLVEGEPMNTHEAVQLASELRIREYEGLLEEWRLHKRSYDAILISALGGVLVLLGIALAKQTRTGSRCMRLEICVFT